MRPTEKGTFWLFEKAECPLSCRRHAVQKLLGCKKGECKKGDILVIRKSRMSPFLKTQAVQKLLGFLADLVVALLLMRLTCRLARHWPPAEVLLIAAAAIAIVAPWIETLWVRWRKTDTRRRSL